MLRIVPRLVSLAVLLVVLTACDLLTGASPSPAVRALGPGERWLPVARWDLPDGGHMLCAGGGTPAPSGSRWA
jgi:hypothetical protein